MDKFLNRLIRETSAIQAISKQPPRKFNFYMISFLKTVFQRLSGRSNGTVAFGNVSSFSETPFRMNLCPFLAQNFRRRLAITHCVWNQAHKTSNRGLWSYVQWTMVANCLANAHVNSCSHLLLIEGVVIFLKIH